MGSISYEKSGTFGARGYNRERRQGVFVDRLTARTLLHIPARGLPKYGGVPRH